MNKEIQVSISKKADVSILNITGDVTSISGETIEEAYQKVSNAGAKKILFYARRLGRRDHAAHEVPVRGKPQ